MNTARHLTHLTMIAATLAAGFVAQASERGGVQIGPQLVRLDTVVVTGHRVPGATRVVEKTEAAIDEPG